MKNNPLRSYCIKLAWIVTFGISMGYFEASIVVYLRELYYPDGFSFPMILFPDGLFHVELGREFFSIVMIAAVAALAARKLWDWFGWFIIMFGVWDIFYYIWLKVTIGWPVTLFDWDILFLIPLPWIGPVIAPVLIAVLMIVFGVMITRRFALDSLFSATWQAWLLACLGTGIILYSFMNDIDAGLRQALPAPYQYWLLTAGLILYIAGFVHAYRKSLQADKTPAIQDAGYGHLPYSPFQP